jgi:hypothetical protein
VNGERTGTVLRARLQRRIGARGLVLVVVVALIAGAVVGRAVTASMRVDLRGAIESSLVPLSLDADAVWMSGSDDRPSVVSAIAALRAGDPSPVLASSDAWLEAYDTILVRMVGTDLPGPSRSVQRQFVAAVTLSRDAVEVLARAAAVGEGPRRDDLLDAAVRLRQRSEQVLLSARASIDDLEGERRRVALLPPVRPFGGIVVDILSPRA